MQGLIIAGGLATRLRPLTLVTNKHLLPVYDKPMIYYPIEAMQKAGIKEVLLTSAGESISQFANLLKSGEEFGIRLYYGVQQNPKGGIADAIAVAEEFTRDEPLLLILGDNIFEDDFSKVIKKFNSGGHIFAKKVYDPERFAVAQFNKKWEILKIIEKPKKFISPFAIPGLYLYDHRIVEVAKKLNPSNRGELEIVDCHNYYLKKSELKVTKIEGAWMDAGTPNALLEAANTVKRKKIYEKFDPIVKKALKEYCENHKGIVKKRLRQ